METIAVVVVAPHDDKQGGEQGGMMDVEVRGGGEGGGEDELGASVFASVSVSLLGSAVFSSPTRMCSGIGEAGAVEEEMDGLDVRLFVRFLRRINRINRRSSKIGLANSAQTCPFNPFGIAITTSFGAIA
mmetsp:Transcript_2128/g.3006  ORF Transcript_2128/g.3006 Transcript_2128/m.3006 type:complete len:130 (-) Transcript_2128:936-1325(-)